MSLLSIARSLALNVGMEPFGALFASASREAVEVIRIANEVGDELARRVQWGALTNTATMSGSGALPADFQRLVEGVCVTSAQAAIRPLSRSEWTMEPSAGTPRYFLLEGKDLTLWPEGPAQIVYQKKDWIIGGLSEFSADDQETVFDEELFVKALIVRWRRQKGMPFADEEAEYEAALAMAAERDDRGRL